MPGDQEPEAARPGLRFLLVALLVVAAAVAGAVLYLRGEDASPPPACRSTDEPRSTVPASCPTS